MAKNDGRRLRLAGECCLVLGLVGWLSERHMASLPQAAGTVREVAIREQAQRGLGWSWVPSVTYEYSVDGTRYSGDRFSWRPLSERADEFSGPSPALSGLLAAYSPGGPARVYYDPRYPQNSFLLLNPAGRYSGLARFGALLFLSGFLLARRRAAKAPRGSVGLKT